VSVAHLRFDWQDFLNEVDAMEGLSSEFVEKNSSWLFDKLRRELRGAKASAGHQTVLEIPEESPLLTIATDREYESGKNHAGSYNIVGSLSAKWEITVQGTGRNSELHLTGNATTKVELFHIIDGEPSLIHMWRMEVGAEDSPGCCFHVQVGFDGSIPFPRDLPVPRLPTFVVTPMAATEFLLGELFQDRWPRVAGRVDKNAQLWRRVQSHRWKTLLDWQTTTLRDAAGSPWPALKGFPGPDYVF
jgi:hypothetical protein